MQEYHKNVSLLAYKIMQIISLSLGLNRDFFDKFMDKPIAILRLLHYNDKKSEIENGIFGCGNFIFTNT